MKYFLNFLLVSLLLSMFINLVSLYGTLHNRPENIGKVWTFYDCFGVFIIIGGLTSLAYITGKLTRNDYHPHK